MLVLRDQDHAGPWGVQDHAGPWGVQDHAGLGGPGGLTCELQSTDPPAVVSSEQRQTLECLDVPDVDGRVPAHLPGQTANQSRSRVRVRIRVRRAYLGGGHVVLERVHGQAEDVVVVAQVEPLGVLQPAVDHGHGGHVEDHVPRLAVEQVVATVEAAVAAGTGESLSTNPNRTASVLTLTLTGQPQY